MAGIPGYSKRYHPSLVIVQICFPGDRCTTLLLDIYNHTQFEATFLELLSALLADLRNICLPMTVGILNVPYF